MDFLRDLLKIKESSPEVSGFSYDKLSDRELIDACREMGLEDTCVIDGEGGLVNRKEVIDELQHADVDFHGDEVPGETNDVDFHTDKDWRDRYGQHAEPMECVVMDGNKKVKEFETMAQAKEYVGKHKDKKLTIKEAKQYTKYTNLRKKFDYYKPVKMKQLKEMASNERSVYPNAKVVYSKSGKPVGEVYLTDRTNAPGRWGCLHYGFDFGSDSHDTEREAYDALREMHAEWLQRRRHSRGNQMAEGVKTVSFKDPYKKLAQPAHGGKQGDVNNKSAKKAIEDEIGNAGMKGMKKKDRPYMEKPRFRDWLTGNMYFNMTKSGELAGNMKLSEGKAKRKTMKACYDCGSTITGHHTKECELSGSSVKRDLPSQKGTQWWTGEVPQHLKESVRTLTPEEQQELMRFARGRGIELQQAVHDETSNTIHWEGTHRSGDTVHGEYDLKRHASRWIDVKDEYTKERPQLRQAPVENEEEHDYEVYGSYEARQDMKPYRRTFKAVSPEAAKAKALANLQGMAARKANRISRKSIKVRDAKRIEPKQDWWK